MKHLTIIITTLLAFFSLGCRAQDTQLVMVFTDNDGEQQNIPVELISSIVFDSDIVNEFKEGHGVVDLGLSVKWAYANLDLSAPNMEAGPYEPSQALYGWADPTGEKRSTTATDYPNSSETGSAFPPDNIEGTALDIVRTHWGGEWRLPTDAEMKELCKSCTWEYEEVNNTPGYRVTGPNGNSIFLPANGWRYADEYGSQGVYGGYWSGTLSHDDMECARSLAFNAVTHDTGYTRRHYGLAIRPVINP